jgi:DNA (cytosine-5)-methyltransferase 1
MQRHFFWSNFKVAPRKFDKADIRHKNKISDFDGQEIVAASKIPNKRQALRNCVDAELGLHILTAAMA